MALKCVIFIEKLQKSLSLPNLPRYEFMSTIVIYLIIVSSILQ